MRETKNYHKPIFDRIVVKKWVGMSKSFSLSWGAGEQERPVFESSVLEEKRSTDDVDLESWLKIREVILD